MVRDVERGYAWVDGGEWVVQDGVCHCCPLCLLSLSSSSLYLSLGSGVV